MRHKNAQFNMLAFAYTQMYFILVLTLNVQSLNVQSKLSNRSVQLFHITQCKIFCHPIEKKFW